MSVFCLEKKEGAYMAGSSKGDVWNPEAELIQIVLVLVSVSRFHGYSHLGILLFHEI